MSTQRRLGFVLLCSAALGACIASEGRPGAEADGGVEEEVAPGDVDEGTVGSDGTIEPEDGSGGDGIDPGDGQVIETDDDALDETVVSTCSEDRDCGVGEAQQTCRAWTCDDGTCRQRGLGPETACDNGRGPAAGTCLDGGFSGPDHCDDGECVDDLPPTDEIRGPRFEGTWFFVRTTFGRVGVPGTSRGIVTMDGQTNSFGLGARDGDGPTPVIDLQEGLICGADDGAVEASVGAWSLIGHQVDGLAVMTDSLNDGFDLMLRADEGSTTQVDGTYRYFQTSIVFGDDQPTTWIGTVRFQDGCLENGQISTDPSVSGPYTYETGPEDCLTASTAFGEAGLFTLGTHVVSGDGADPTRYPIFYRGAIGRDGDLLVLVKETDTGVGMRLEYGVTVLVRQDGATVSASALAGAWQLYQQARLGGDPPRRDAGWVEWSAPGTIDGGQLTTLDGRRDIAGRWFAIDEVERRFSQVLVIGSLQTAQVGVFSPSNRVGLGWVVDDAQVGRTPVALGPTPRGGSLVVLLRP